MKRPSGIMTRRIAARLLPLLIAGAAVGMPAPQPPSRDAVRSLSRKAAEGDPLSLFRMAMLYERGYDSIPADSLKALEMYRLAAEGGYLPAMNQLGFLLMNSDGPDASRREGLRWIEKAAIQGDLKAASNLGWLLMQGDLVDKDYDKALFWLRKGADGGLPVAMSMLGDLYREGRGVPADSTAADSLYRAAFEHGLRDAGYKLADMYESRIQYLTPDSCVIRGRYFYLRGIPSEGVRYFRIAANAGHPTALALIGDAYARAMGVAYDHELSNLYFTRAAMAGDPSAAFFIGELLEMFPDALDTIPSLPSPAPAFWFDRAAAGGVTDAEAASRRLLTEE